ncbi:hypothetical protein QR685DRAFT_443157, partial [Neurospora intermedia]
GYPFEIIDGLLYNINLTNKIRRLYIPKSIVVMILIIVYDKKYYFGTDHIFHNIKNYITISKIY